MDRNIIGENIRRLRENAGFSQANLAGFLGVDQSFISKVEKGERQISSDMLEKLAPLFGVHSDSFIREEIEPTKFAVAFRGKDLTNEDLEAISAINNIALNLDFLSDIGEEVLRD